MKTIIGKYSVYFFATLLAFLMAGNGGIAGSGTNISGKPEVANYYFDGITGEISKEYAVDLAKWMVDLSAWNVYAFEEAAEADLDLAEWMTDLSAWNVYAFEEAVETEPGLEDWMTDIFAWDIYPFLTASENEPEIEQWMIDIGSWNIINSRDCDEYYVFRHRKC